MAESEQNPRVIATHTSPQTTVPETPHQNLSAKYQLQCFTCVCNSNMCLTQEGGKDKVTEISYKVFYTTLLWRITEDFQDIPVYCDSSLIQTKDILYSEKKKKKITGTCYSWKLLYRPWKQSSAEYQLNGCTVTARSQNRLIKVSLTINKTDFSVSNL